MWVSSKQFSRFLRAAALALLAATTLPLSAARAQSIVATVNGEPITTLDIAEREKLLSALGQPSAASAAMESMVKSRIEAGEINKYGIKVSSGDLGSAVQYFAERAHVSTEVMSGRLQNSRVDKKHMENFLSIHTAFNIYARARNRAVEVSQSEIDAELAHDKKLAQQHTYVIRQVLVTVPPEAGASGLQQGAKEMETLHARFTDCETGAKLVTEFPNLVLREPVTRSTSQLGEQLSAALDKLAVGHLTPASRDSNGIVALALCSRTAANSDTAREAASQRIMGRNIQRDAEKLYLELRANAVIVNSKK